MKAIVASNEGAVVRNVPKPSLADPNQVLVRVKANAVNRADLMMLNGASHGGWGGGEGKPLGLEWAGEIVEVGTGVKDYCVGDRVMGPGSASFAEYVIANQRVLIPIPEDTSYEQAATLPVAMMTMHDAIVTNGKLTPGQTVLFQGASSAMGMIGMQIAQYLGAGMVIGTSRSSERCQRLLELGADLAVNSREQGWVDRVHKATNGTGVDLLIDFLAGPMVNGNLLATRVGGRMINIGRLAGENGEMNFDLHNMRRISYIGCSFRMRSLAETAEVISKTGRDLAPALAKGALQMPIDKVYPFEEAAEAFKRMASSQGFGKIVIMHY